MKSFDSPESKSFSYFSAGFISIVLHIAVLALLFVFARMTPAEPPPPLTVTMLSEVQPERILPPPPTLEPPTPELPEPEPEPPAPEPPKPEPPVPEPVKSEPVKVKESPKPEPPKPVKPEPVKVKESPKPEPSKAKPAPSLAERLRAAEVKSSPSSAQPRSTPKPVSNPDDIRKRLTQGVIQQRVTTSSALSTLANMTSAQRVAAVEAVNYAEMVVNPYLSPFWQEYGPTRGELGNQLPKPVKVEFTVLEDGRIVGLRISERSNSAAMNQAVDKLLARLRNERLPSLPASGVKSKSLPIVIYLETRS